ncbi:MAG: tetratricopeptide repeat protein [Pseudomonadota bacterium]
MTVARPKRSFRSAFLALAIAAPLLAACDSVEERVATHYERGQELAEAGENAKAIVEYRNAISLKADHVPSRLAIATLLEEEGNLGEAVRHYQIAAENDLKNVRSRVRLSQYMLVTRNIDRALEFSEQAYALDPEDPDVLAVRSATAYQLQDKEFALELARKAIAAEPDHAAANVVLITERVESGELDEALSMTDNVLSVHDEDLSLHLLRLRLLELTDQQELALEQLVSITQKFPELGSAKQALARRYTQLGELDKAEEQLRSYAEIAEDRTAANLAIAQFMMRTQGMDAGVAELQRLAAEEQNGWPYTRALASLFYARDRGDEARTMLEAVVQGEGAMANEARVMLARFALQERDKEGARALIDAVLASDKANADALTMRGALEIDADQYGQAIETLRNALAQNATDSRTQRLLGRAYLLNGNEALAADQFANATRNSDYAPDVAQEYVQFLIRRGRIDGAEAVLSEAVRRSPTNRTLLTALAQLRLQQQDWVGAETVANQLRELEGGGTVAEQVLAASLSGQEKYDESSDILRSLVADDETRGQAMAGLVNTLLADGKADEARAFLNDVLAEDPGNVQARLLQASVEQREGNADLARELVERVNADFPNQSAPYLFLARSELSAGNTDEAYRIAREGVDATGALNLRLIVAGIDEQRGDVDSAIEQYQAVFDARPDSLLAANNLASMLSMHKSDDPEALKRAQTIALRLRSSDVPEMQDTFGWTLYLNGDYRGALQSLEPAAEKLSNNPIVLYHYGMTLKALGRDEEARRVLDRSAALADDSFPYPDGLTQALAELPELPPEEPAGEDGGTANQ